MKAAVFDFDGTLADTMEFWGNLAKNYLSSLGIKASKDLDESLEKLTVEEGISYMKEEYRIEKTHAEIRSEMDELLFNYYREEVKLKPYVLKALEMLDGKGVRVAIASVIDEELIKSVLKRYDMEDYFEFIQTCENTGLSKDDKSFFDLLPKRLNLRPDEVYMFEDSLYPIISAKESGLRVVGVEDGSAAKDKKEIISLSDIYIKNFSELVDLLDKGNFNEV